MSLQLVTSNSLERLADRLRKKINLNPKSVFTPITIVTQTEGINLWLREYIAQNDGIAANIQFITPNDIVFKIFQVLGGTYKETMSRDSMIWLLYKIIGDKDFENRFPEQLRYFEKPIVEKDKKRMGMATKIADLFDQYQIYRESTISKWNEAPMRSSYAPYEWQEYLWKKLRQETPKDIQDKTLVKVFIEKALHDEENQKKIMSAIPDIYLFGLSIFTNYHLDILKKIGAFVNVHFFLLNPAPQIYWMDDSSDKQIAKRHSNQKKDDDIILIGNPLLTNWGKVLQNTFRLLYRSDELFNDQDSEHVEALKTDTLLHKIQANIFHNLVEDPIMLTNENLEDDTLSLHSCYTIASEVEALYNYLVHLVDKKRAPLSARDISVMVSDIDKYEPYIKAVFDNAPYKFKYKIADVSVSDGDNIYSALRLILELNEQDFTSEKVLQLLDSSYIRQRFKLQDIDALRIYMDQSNIRFGIDGDMEDDTYLLSWRYGIRRLMFGLCMSGELLTNADDTAFFPVDIIEGHNSQEVIRFCHFVELLLDALKKRHSNRTPSDWIEYIQWLLENMIYQVVEQLDEDYYDLQEQLSKYAELTNIQLEKVPFDVFRLHFLSTLDATKRSSLFINDGITFCSLIPMRSIPFKVIAMLGMTAKDFPRKEKPLSFSLLQQRYQLGDRNIKDNDKHLFLETIISAKEYLYISYIGHSVKDNKPLPASILVEELVDYVKTLSKGLKEQRKDNQDKKTNNDKTENPPEEKDLNASKCILTQHPLHNYSVLYNTEPFKLYRYSALESQQINIFSNEKKDLVQNSNKEISVASLLAFFKNAPKSFYNNVLGVYYENDSTLVSETEIFELNHLENAILKNQLLQKKKEEIPDWKQKLKLTGKIPLKNVGEVSLQLVEEKVLPIKIKLQEEFPHIEETRIAVLIELENIAITGDIGGVYGDRLVAVCFSKNINKPILSAYIQAMIGVAMGKITELIFIVANDDGPDMQFHKIPLRDVSSIDAQQFLQKLTDIYQEGMQSPYPFADLLYNDMNFDKVSQLEENKLDDIVNKKFDTKNNFTIIDEYNRKAYHQKVWEGSKALTAFQQAFMIAFEPIHDHFPDLFEKK